jgi:drug/metabolite transporter (DMT)-like permease
MQNRQLSYLLIPLLACIWGSSFILMKRGMFTTDGTAVFSAAQVASIRIFAASSIFLPLLPKLLKKLTSPKDFLYFAVVGWGGNLIPAYLFTYAEQTLDSGIAGIMNSFTPIFTLVVGTLIFRTQISTQQLIGTLIGFTGISWLILLSSPVQSGFQLAPALSILLATLLYGFSLNTIKHKLSNYNPIQIATGGFSLAFIPAVCCFFYFDTPGVFSSNIHAWSSLQFILILGLIGTAFAVILFNRIIAQTTALAASTVTYFIPIIAVAIGIYNGERFVWQQLLAMLVIITGVLLVNINWRKSNKKEEKA